jgi:predicted N-acetyltransferase YhbS
MLNLRFRKVLNNKDKHAFAKILKETGFFNQEEIDMALELIDDYLHKKEASDYRFLIAQQHNEPYSVIAYTCFGHIPGTLNNYDLYWIVVTPYMQNKGIGKKLLIKTEQIIAKLGGNKLYAETSGRPKYYPTHQFYIHNDFIMEARLKDFYAPNDDKLIFSKRIQ